MRESMASKFYTDLLAGNGLLGSFEQLIDHLLRLESDETEAFPLVLRFIKWHLNFNDLLKKFKFH